MNIKIFLISFSIIVLFSCNSSKNGDEKPAVVISPDKMNVLYVGIDNPVTVSVTGIPASKVKLKMEDGKVTGENGHYLINVSSQGIVKVEVSGEKENGEKLTFPPITFRAKRVPDPVIYFAGKKGEDIVSRPELEKAERVDARMEDFDFDLHFDVASFDMVFTFGTRSIMLPSNSASLIPEMHSQFTVLPDGSSIPPGSHVIIQNVKVKGSDGSTRMVPGLNLTVL